MSSWASYIAGDFSPYITWSVVLRRGTEGADILDAECNVLI